MVSMATDERTLLTFFFQQAISVQVLRLGPGGLLFKRLYEVKIDHCGPSGIPHLWASYLAICQPSRSFHYATVEPPASGGQFDSSPFAKLHQFQCIVTASLFYTKSSAAKATFERESQGGALKTA